MKVRDVVKNLICGVRPSLQLSIHPSVRLSIHPPIHSPTHPSTPVYLSVSLHIHSPNIYGTSVTCQACAWHREYGERMTKQVPPPTDLIF